MSDQPEHTLGSGNVFADLDYPEPEEALLKAQLAREITAAMTLPLLSTGHLLPRWLLTALQQRLPPTGAHPCPAAPGPGQRALSPSPPGFPS
jgi:hypothetical protein